MCRRRFRRQWRLRVHSTTAGSFRGEALTEAVRLRRPVYDMVYFVLARRLGATLFTLDKRLQALCIDNGVNCVRLDTQFGQNT